MLKHAIISLLLDKSLTFFKSQPKCAFFQIKFLEKRTQRKGRGIKSIQMKGTQICDKFGMAEEIFTKKCNLYFQNYSSSTPYFSSNWLPFI